MLRGATVCFFAREVYPPAQLFKDFKVVKVLKVKQPPIRRLR